jgi:hypothetical protein
VAVKTCIVTKRSIRREWRQLVILKRQNGHVKNMTSRTRRFVGACFESPLALRLCNQTFSIIRLCPSRKMMGRYLN